MRDAITISVPGDLRRRIDEMAKGLRRGRSDLVREALEQYLARAEFRRLRRAAIPEAERRGLFSDDDAFERIS